MTSCFRARTIYPVSGPPIDGGLIDVRNGRVARIARRPGGPVTDLGDVVVLPAFINAHTHLDLTDLAGRIPPLARFIDWLAALVPLLAGRDAPSVDAAIVDGVGRMEASGAQLVGDIRGPFSHSGDLPCPQIDAMIWREVLGHRPERFEPLWQSAKAFLIGADNNSASHRHASVSPHAPYSTSPEVYQRAGQLNCPWPIATHWFESPEEMEWLASGGGPLRDWLASIGAISTEQKGLADPWELTLSGPGSAKWVLIHGNFLSAADLERMTRPAERRRLAGVVFCPRTHAYFGHPRHPWRSIRASGIPVGLGTDSLASNPDLEIFSEARHVAAHDVEANPARVLEMLTTDGANCLGLADRWGVIAPGRAANFTLVKPGPGNALSEAILHPESRVAGIIRHGVLERREPIP